MQTQNYETKHMYNVTEIKLTQDSFAVSTHIEADQCIINGASDTDCDTFPTLLHNLDSIDFAAKCRDWSSLRTVPCAFLSRSKQN